MKRVQKGHNYISPNFVDRTNAPNEVGNVAPPPSQETIPPISTLLSILTRIDKNLQSGLIDPEDFAQLKQHHIDTIKNTQHEIQALREQLSLNQPDQLSNTQKLRELEQKLSESFALFSRIRTKLGIMHDKPHALKENKKSIKEKHAILSSVMLQKNDSLTARVVWKLPKIHLRHSVKTILLDRTARQQLKEIALISLKALPQSLAAVFKKPSESHKRHPLNNAIAKVANRLYNLGTYHARRLFGADLIAVSRNVVSDAIIESGADIRLIENNKKKFLQCAKQLHSVEELVETDLHKHSIQGICFGMSLELARQAIVEPDFDYTQAVENLHTQGNAAAQVHQSFYEALPKKFYYEQAQIKERISAQLKNDAPSLFAANEELFGHLQTYLTTENRIDRSVNVLKSPASVKELFEFLDTHFKANNEIDLKLFKEKAQEKIKALYTNPDQQTKALNSLDWAIARYELNQARKVLESKLKFFVNAKGKKINAAYLVRGGMKALFSNPRFGPIMLHLYYCEEDLNHMQTVAYFRGLELESMDRVTGNGIAAKDDKEILNKISELEDGSYLITVQFGRQAHALNYYKKNGKEFLFDPILGAIDCSNGRLEEQFLKLMSLPCYPPARFQGPASLGKGHNIEVLKVKKAKGLQDTYLPL